MAYRRGMPTVARTHPRDIAGRRDARQMTAMGH